MEVVVKKVENNINIVVDKKIIKYKKNYCIIIGNIYNLDDFKINGKSNEEIILKLFDKYRMDLLTKLNGDYSLIIVKNNKLYLIRDKIGSKHLYYYLNNDEFICTNNLKNIIDCYKKDLVIDKQSLSNYLCYSYIKVPYTIFKDVYKLKPGEVVVFDKSIEKEVYYDLIEEYKYNKNKVNNISIAVNELEKKLINSIEIRCKNYKKIGVFFSSGVDSTLISSLACKIPDKEINTYTIGFYDEERNEAPHAKIVANYLKTKHHEFYLDSDIAIKLLYDSMRVYSEPFADPSLIPTMYLNSIVDKDIEIVLTGDGADQMFLGSNIYDKFGFSNKIKRLENCLFHKDSSYLDIYANYGHVVNNFVDTKVKSYNNLSGYHIKSQIKYMLLDMTSFLPDRLFTKVSNSAIYNNINVAHPFIDDDVIDYTLKMSNKLKYNHGNKKHILKEVLYKNIPRDMMHNNKKGFGIPMKSWIYGSFYDDIIKFCNYDILKKQGLFNPDKIKIEIEKLNNKTLLNRELNIFFSIYIFQLWYQEYIEDLWK